MTYTKEQLGAKYGIKANNTVRRLLAACGLSTSRQSYTQEEVTTRFHVAHDMIYNKGYKYADVESHFRPSAKDVGNQSTATNTASNAAGFACNDLQQLAQQAVFSQFATHVQHAATMILTNPELVNQMVDVAVAQAIPPSFVEDYQVFLEARVQEIQTDPNQLLLDGLVGMGLIQEDTRFLLPSASVESDSSPSCLLEATSEVQ